MSYVVMMWTGAVAFVALIGPLMMEPVFLLSVGIAVATSLIVGLASNRR